MNRHYTVGTYHQDEELFTDILSGFVTKDIGGIVFTDIKSATAFCLKQTLETGVHYMPYLLEGDVKCEYDSELGHNKLISPVLIIPISMDTNFFKPLPRDIGEIIDKNFMDLI